MQARLVLAHPRYTVETNPSFTQQVVETLEGIRHGFFLCQWNGERWVVVKTMW